VSQPEPAPDNSGKQEAPPEPQSPERFERRWVWMDRWDPSTWEMPSNPTKLQRVLAGVALIIVFVMTVYVPFRMLGVF
jgi:hypothetical protein